MSESYCLRKQTTANDELRAISEAFCSRREERDFGAKERSDVARNRAMGGQRGP